MRKRLFNNPILARAQACVVALLYVFLCTFGMVTHTHAPGEDLHAIRATSRQAPSAPDRLYSPSDNKAFAAAAHCAFCDWQANCHAQTVAVWRFAAPLSRPCVYARLSVSVVPVLPVRSACRAPPRA